MATTEETCEPSRTRQDKTKEKEAAADAGKSELAAGPASAYPDWLSRGVGHSRAMEEDGRFPGRARVYRRLARESIRAELRWRGGEPDESIRRDLGQILAELTAAMKQAEDIPRPPVRSVGQARAFGRQPDPALKAALAGLLALRRELPAGSPDVDKAVKERLAKFKDKAGLDLAEALVDASEGEILDPKTLAFLDGIVKQSEAILDPSRSPRDILELRFLQQLAGRAEMPGEWKPDTARIGLEDGPLRRAGQ